MRNWLVSLLVVIAIPFSSLLKAEDKQPLLRIGVPENFPPFYFQDQNGQFHGASYEVVVTILTSLGYRVETTQYPNMRQALAQIGSGEEDIIVNLTGTESRRKVAYFTNTPHIYESQDIIVRADSNIRYDGKLLQLSPYKIGVIFGWTYGPDFDSADYLSKEYVNNSEDQIKGLLSGNFDIMVNNKNFVESLSREIGVSNAFKAIDNPIFILPVTIAVSKVYPGALDLVDQLEQEVMSFRHTPEYKTILERYGFDPEMLTKEGLL